MKHIVVLVKDVPPSEEESVKEIINKGEATNVMFYPFRDAFVDKGFNAGELIITDDNFVAIHHTQINLKEAITSKIK